MKITREPGDPKPGMYSTEFWGKVVLQSLALLTLIGVIDLGVEQQQAAAAAIVTLLEIGYQISRGNAKRGAAEVSKGASPPIKQSIE